LYCVALSDWHEQKRQMFGPHLPCVPTESCSGLCTSSIEQFAAAAARSSAKQLHSLHRSQAMYSAQKKSKIELIQQR
jgi:hypothetical protein